MSDQYTFNGTCFRFLPMSHRYSSRHLFLSTVLGSIPESTEYDSCEGEGLNLGAESPFLRATDSDSRLMETSHALEDNWGSIPLHSSVAARKRIWRSSERDKKRRDVVDGDCGIW